MIQTAAEYQNEHFKSEGYVFFKDLHTAAKELCKNIPMSMDDMLECIEDDTNADCKILNDGSVAVHPQSKFLCARVQKDDRQEGGAVQLSFNEQMAVAMKRRGVSVAQLAERLGKSRQNVNNRLNNSDFTSAEMKKWAGAIGCDVFIEVTER